MKRFNLFVLVLVTSACALIGTGCGEGATWHSPGTWGDTQLDKAEKAVEAAEAADENARAELEEAVAALEAAKESRKAEQERMDALATRAAKVSGEDKIAKLTEEKTAAEKKAADAAAELAKANEELNKLKQPAPAPAPTPAPQPQPEPTPEPAAPEAQ